jgi:hypothetical protein
LLATASLRELVAEAAPYIAGGVSSEQRFVSLESGSFAPANSLWSKNLFFLDCINAATDQFVLLERTEQSRRAALNYCLSQASAVLAAEPAYAMAWMVKAVAAGELGMADTMKSAVVEAWRTSPNLEWMAQQRIDLVDRQAALATSPAIQANYRSDIAVQFGSWNGVDFLAHLYVRREDRRELITTAVESAPPGQQALFLQRVKIVAGGGA